MRISLSLPSKTFLIGEYAVLSGGPALLVNTNPRFRMVISLKGQSQVEGVHPSSPGGLWIRSHRDDFVGVNAWFEDPHNQRGGFGASSAQFSFCYAWSKIKNSSLTAWARGLHAQNLFEEFRTQAAANGSQSSGADVVAQATGGVTYFQSQPFAAESWDWPFQDLSLLLLHTGRKINTHTHLNGVDRGQLTSLTSLAAKACEAFKTANSDLFVDCINQYSAELKQLGLVESQSLQQLTDLSQNRSVLAAKGCGAMGADVLLVLCRPNDFEAVKSAAQAMSLTPVATEKDLSDGFRLEVEMEPRFDVFRNRREQQGLIDA